MRAAAADIARRHRLEVKIEQIWYFPPSPFARELVEAVRRGAEQAGYPHMDIVSGAGHDACYVSRRGADGDGLRAVQGRHQPQRDRGRHQGRHRRGLPDPAAGDGRAGERVKIRRLVSAATAALVATVAGVGGTLPVVLAAAQAVGATPEQASSWVSGLGLATARQRADPQRALPHADHHRLVDAGRGADRLDARACRASAPRSAPSCWRRVLILLTAAIRPLGAADREDPGQHRRRHAGRHPAAAGRGDGRAGADRAAAGAAADRAVPGRAHLVPTLASLIVLAAGAALAWSLGLVKPIPPLGLSQLVIVDAGVGRGDADRARRAALSRHHGVAEPAGLRRAARLGLPAADPAGAGGDRRGLARHGVPRRPHLEPGGDLGRALHRPRRPSRSGQALDGRAVLRPVAGA